MNSADHLHLAYILQHTSKIYKFVVDADLSGRQTPEALSECLRSVSVRLQLIAGALPEGCVHPTE